MNYKYFESFLMTLRTIQALIYILYNEKHFSILNSEGILRKIAI